MLHDESFGIVPIFFGGNSIKYLILQNKNSSHRGFPKGHAEGNENILESAIREFEEETGIPSSNLHILSDNFFVENYDLYNQKGQKVNKTVKYWLAIVDNDSTISVQQKEIVDYRICEFRDALQIITYNESKNTIKNAQKLIDESKMTKKLSDQIKISIDGFGGTGKSTTAKIVANKLNYMYVDSGAIYRALTLYIISKYGSIESPKDNHTISTTEINFKSPVGKNEDMIKKSLNGKIESILSEISINQKLEDGELKTYLNGECVNDELRTPIVNANVAKVADLKSVRVFVNQILSKIGNHGGVIMDGRDIGSVVWPDAELKIYMQTDLKIRANRRYDETITKNPNTTLKEVEKNISDRDSLDKQRIDVLFDKFEDQICTIDNTKLSIEKQVWTILEKYYQILISK